MKPSPDKETLKTYFSQSCADNECGESQKVKQLLKNIDLQKVEEKIKERRAKIRISKPEYPKKRCELDLSKLNNNGLIGFPETDHSVFHKIRKISKELHKKKTSQNLCKRRVNAKVAKKNSLETV